MRDVLEALLFVHGDPISWEQLASWASCSPEEAERLVNELDADLGARGSGLVVQRVGGGVRLAARPDLHEALRERLQESQPEPLSHASWEVLAIVAYRQPVTRLEIETVRQTGSERALETLLGRDLIEEVGRKEAPGRPILYGTTQSFLLQFGLDGVDQLPPLSTRPK